MKVGDLIKLKNDCIGNPALTICPCWFCYTSSSGIGTIVSQHLNDVGIFEWDVLFDAGIYTLHTEELEVIK